MVVAISMIRDESDIVRTTVGHMLTQVDEVWALDNGSTDGTAEILEELGATVLDDPEPGYYQSRKLSALAEDARRAGADWVVPFDADEFWLGHDERRIADILGELPPETLVAEATVLDHVATDEIPSPWRRAEALPLRKIACRPLPGVTIAQGNHSATFEGVSYPLTVTGQLEVRHFPHRSSQQMIRKARNGAAAYAATHLPEDIGAHWRQWGKLTDEQLRDVFFTYYHSADPESDGLVYDPCVSSVSSPT